MSGAQTISSGSVAGLKELSEEETFAFGFLGGAGTIFGGGRGGAFFAGLPRLTFLCLPRFFFDGSGSGCEAEEVMRFGPRRGDNEDGSEATSSTNCS